jgi:hypothetical protein
MAGIALTVLRPSARRFGVGAHESSAAVIAAASSAVTVIVILTIPLGSVRWANIRCGSASTASPTVPRII